jgi:hypothetical protein
MPWVRDHAIVAPPIVNVATGFFCRSITWEDQKVSLVPGTFSQSSAKA